MKKIFILPAIVTSLFLACVKDNKGDLGDLGGPYTLNGTLRLYDTLTGGYSTSGVSPILVYLKYTTDSAGFLSSTTSNAGGQYSFVGIDPARAYTVYALLDSNKLHYYGDKAYHAGTLRDRQSDTLLLTPSQSNQNGVFYHLVDSTGAAFAGGTLFIFNGKQARDNKDTLHYTWKLSSDNFGRVLQLNIAPGNYYAYAAGVLRNLTLEGMDDVTVQAAGIRSRAIDLNRVKSCSLQVDLMDGSQNPMSNINVYIYNNQGLWNNPDDSTGVGSIYQLKSDVNGKCMQPNMTPGNYFIHAYARFGAISARGHGTIQVGGDTTTLLKLPVSITNP